VPVFAPLGLLLAYMLTMPNNAGCCDTSFFNNYGAIAGWTKMSVGAALAASVMAFFAISRERDRDAEDLHLKFELERARLEKLSMHSRMEAMRLRMEPHFLFNTLANIQQLVRDGSPTAADVLSSLTAYLRAAIVEDRNGMSHLAQEFERVKHYLAIMQMRFPDRLQFTVQLPTALQDQAFPALALLTLVENAVAHGIDPSEEGGRVQLSAQSNADGLVQVDVLNTGAPLDPAANKGFGLRNLQERLAAAWGDKASLVLHTTPDGTLARITMPRTTSTAA
jgi:LytS/YehU family sensor histidine kinase